MLREGSRFPVRNDSSATPARHAAITAYYVECMHLSGPRATIFNKFIARADVLAKLRKDSLIVFDRNMHIFIIEIDSWCMLTEHCKN